MKTGSNVEDKGDPVRSNVHDDEVHEQEQDQDENDYAVIPPNGGWGWVVVISAFYCNIVTDGIQFTFGLFLRKIADYFDAEESKISLVGSLMFGMHLIVGPVCSGLNNMCGIRPVAVTGSILTALGIALCYFSPNYEFLYLFYGILGGIGLGMVYMNTIIITSLYFTSLRILAVGIVVCGTGCGTFMFALLGNELLKIMDWQTSFLVEAALAGSMGTAALTFRPLKPQKIIITTDKALLFARHSIISKTSKMSTFSSVTEVESIAGRSRRRTTIYIRKDSNARGTASDHTIAMEKFVHKTILQQLTARVCCPCCRRGRQDLVFIHPEEKDEKFEEYPDITGLQQRASVSSTIGSPFPRLSTEAGRPLPPTETKKRCAICGPVKDTIRMIFDFRLLRSYAFLLYCISGSFAVSSVLIILIYEKETSIQVHGFSEDTATYLLVALGAANTFWRLFLGLLSTGVKINKTGTSMALAFVGSVSVVASTFWDNIYFQYSCKILIALAMASFAVFRPVILIDLVGSDLLINASGISLLFMGVMCIVFPPLSGLIMEATHNTRTILYVAGILHFVSGLLLIKIQNLREYDLKRLQPPTE